MSSSFFGLTHHTGGQKTYFRQFYPIIVVYYAQSFKPFSGIPPNLSCVSNKI